MNHEIDLDIPESKRQKVAIENGNTVLDSEAGSKTDRSTYNLNHKLIHLNKEDDEILRSNIINNPIQGYFYYCHIGDQLGILISKLEPNHDTLIKFTKCMSLLKFDDWDKFVDWYRFNSEDKKIWKKISSRIDMVLISKLAIKYRRFLVELINILYLGSINDNHNKTIHKLLSKKLIEYKVKLNEKNNNEWNTEYYKILCKEFNDFFDYNTGFGNTFRLLIKHEDIYVVENRLYKDNDIPLMGVVKWKSNELNTFYESLARLSIQKADEISKLLPNKSTHDVVNLYGALKSELNVYKNDNELKNKLLSINDFPKAYEMSEEYVTLEERFSASIEKLEEDEISRKREEYKEYVTRDLKRESSLFFKIPKSHCLFRLINNTKKDVVKHTFDDPALFDMYFIAKDYLTELIRRLYQKKITELSNIQELEWEACRRCLEPIPDFKSMVSVFDSKNLNRIVKLNENDAIFKLENDYLTSDEELDYMPEIKQFEKEFLYSRSLGISSNFDKLGLSISKKDVEIINEDLLQEHPTKKDLWNLLKSGVTTEEYARCLHFEYSETEYETEEENNDVDDISRNRNGEEESMEIENMDSSDNSDLQYNTDEELVDSDESNSSEDNFVDAEENLNSETEINDPFSNTLGLDDLISDDGNDELDDHSDDEEQNSLNANLDDVDDDGEDGFIWYKDEFIIPDADAEFFDKGIVRDVIPGLDLTTRNNRKVQKLCDEEEKYMDVKDLQDSLKYENLHLTQLSHNTEADVLNSADFAEIVANVKSGSTIESKMDLKSQNCGPPPIYGSHILRRIYDRENKCENFISGSFKTSKECEEFMTTFNDY